jgi:hypothetical protein
MSGTAGSPSGGIAVVASAFGIATAVLRRSAAQIAAHPSLSDMEVGSASDSRQTEMDRPSRMAVGAVLSLSVRVIRAFRAYRVRPTACS